MSKKRCKMRGMRALRAASITNCQSSIRGTEATSVNGCTQESQTLKIEKHMATKAIRSMPYSLALRPTVPGDKNCTEKKIYGSIQQRDTIGLRTLASHIHEHGSSFSVGTLQGVLSDMVECTRELLKQGYSVDFEGLMRLYITANSQGVDKVDDFDPTKMINDKG